MCLRFPAWCKYPGSWRSASWRPAIVTRRAFVLCSLYTGQAALDSAQGDSWMEGSKSICQRLAWYCDCVETELLMSSSHTYCIQTRPFWRDASLLTCCRKLCDVSLHFLSTCFLSIPQSPVGQCLSPLLETLTPPCTHLLLPSFRRERHVFANPVYD